MSVRVHLHLVVKTLMNVAYLLDSLYNCDKSVLLECCIIGLYVLEALENSPLPAVELFMLSNSLHFLHTAFFRRFFSGLLHCMQRFVISQ